MRSGWLIGGCLAALTLLLAPAARAQPDASNWRPVPRTAASVPLGTVVLDTAAALRGAPRDNAVALADQGYLEEEYLLSGDAFTTRLLVRRPIDPAAFSGTVYLEPLAAGDETAPIWGAAFPYLLANHDVWVGITVAAASAGRLRMFDPGRYGPLRISDDGQGPAILAEVARQLRRTDGPLAGPGLLDQAAVQPGLLRLYAVGWASAACLPAEFLRTGHHARARRANGRPLIDGYLMGVCASAGPLPVPADAAILQVAVEADYAGQAAATVAALRQDDGSIPGQRRYRWYDLAGTGSADPLDRPDLSIGRFQLGAAGKLTCREPLSQLPGLSHFLRGFLANLDFWIRTGRHPPPGGRFAIDGDGGLGRDAIGNVAGGLRPFWMDIPRARFVAASTPGAEGSDDCGRFAHEVRLPAADVMARYRDRTDYLAKVTAAVVKLANDHHLRADDADQAIGLATRTPFP